MSSSKDDLSALMAGFEAENRAINFLSGKPPSTAVAVAETAARLEIQRWEIERAEMLKRADPRPVYQIYTRDKEFLDRNTSPFCIFDIRAVAHLLSIYATLMPDDAAVVSVAVAKWAVFHKKRSER